MRVCVLTVSVVVVASVAQAAPAALTENELKSAVVDKTIKLDTPIGLPMTIHYGPNGIMTGSVGPALAVYLGAAKDRGRWSVKGDKLCQKWFKWLDADEDCMTIRQDGLKIVWRTTRGRSGTATIDAGPPELSGQTASALGVPPPIPPVLEKKPVPGAVPALPETAQKAPEPAVSAEAAEPQLIERPSPVTRQVIDEWVQTTSVEARAPPEPVARFTRIAAVRIITLPVAATPERSVADPFSDREREPMRQAVDIAAIEAIENRWCLANPLGRWPAGTDPAQATRAANAVMAPDLLAVTAEQNYPGELPLHDAGCLTASPSISAAAMLAADLR